MCAAQLHRILWWICLFYLPPRLWPQPCPRWLAYKPPEAPNSAVIYMSGERHHWIIGTNNKIGRMMSPCSQSKCATAVGCKNEAQQEWLYHHIAIILLNLMHMFGETWRRWLTVLPLLTSDNCEMHLCKDSIHLCFYKMQKNQFVSLSRSPGKHEHHQYMYSSNILSE